MATLLVRNLDDELVARLKQRAKAHGRSAEAEHRVILQEALEDSEAPKTGKELFERCRRFGAADLPVVPDDDVQVPQFD